MALNHVLTRCSPEEVFDHLIHVEEYPQWLLGASEIRRIEDDWPAVGSSFHHTVGRGPFRVEDRSKILVIDRPHRLELHVRATPVVQGHATFRVQGCENGSSLSLQEEPAMERIGAILRPVMDPATHMRNHRSLQKLVQLMDAAHDRADAAGSS